jgi:hypothetical protein
MIPESASSVGREGAAAHSAETGARGGAQTAWFGLVSNRQRWGLSARGGLLLLVMAGVAGLLLVLTVYPFLSVTDRLPSDYLVVEGWVSEQAIRTAVGEFTTNGYKLVVTTGGPVHGMGVYRNDSSTTANVAARRLIDAGLPEAVLQKAPSRMSARDRTFAAAVALREWFNRQHVRVRSINVLTEDVHARRTRLLYQKAFGDKVAVGVIAVPNPDYDPKRWWQYSEGVRVVLGEVIAYIYAKFLFFPPELAAESP